jgi:cytochrome c2
MLIGVIGLAIVGPLVLAAIVAGVMAWLSRQVPAGTLPAPTPVPTTARKPASASAAASPAAIKPAPGPGPSEAGPTLAEADGLEQKATHERRVPVWLVAVYVIVIAWALWFIATQVVPFFKVQSSQSIATPMAATTVTVTPVAPPPAAAPGKGDAANGEKLFASNGCSACHSLKEDEVIVGPSLYHIGQAASDIIKDSGYTGKAKTAQDYVHESIVQPNAYVVPGFAPGIMPQDFGAKLSAQDIDDLIAFLMTK